MHKFTSFLLGLLIGTGSVSAQYYYKDILSQRIGERELDSLKVRKIRKVIVHSFESDGKESEGFYCQKSISRDFRQVETETRSGSSAPSWFTAAYNQQGRITQTTDSSELAVSANFFSYDVKGRIIRIESRAHSMDDDFATVLTEEHLYQYNSAGLPEKMKLVKNGKDTTEFFFLVDDKGNVTDEIQPGSGGRHYYYYYNDRHQLTDIVKFNVVKGKLLPDNIFEYDEDGNLVKMVAVEEGVSGNFVTWRYTYNEGLRIIEKCFGRDNRLLGYVEYEYE